MQENGEVVPYFFYNETVRVVNYYQILDTKVRSNA